MGMFSSIKITSGLTHNLTPALSEGEGKNRLPSPFGEGPGVGL